MANTKLKTSYDFIFQAPQPSMHAINIILFWRHVSTGYAHTEERISDNQICLVSSYLLYASYFFSQVEHSGFIIIFTPHLISLTKQGLFIDFYLWEFIFRCKLLSRYCQHQQSAQNEQVGVSKALALNSWLKVPCSTISCLLLNINLWWAHGTVGDINNLYILTTLKRHSKTLCKYPIASSMKWKADWKFNLVGHQ